MERRSRRFVHVPDPFYPCVHPVAPSAMIRILGIDPGSRVTGYALVAQEGRTYRTECCGVIRLPDAPLTERLETIYAEVRSLAEAQGPTDAAIEALYQHRNVSSAMKLGHARAAAILALRHAGLSVHEYAPSVVKKSASGYGAASKEQLRQTVSRLTGVPPTMPLDASDAIAIALCHLHHHPLIRTGRL